MDLNSNSKEVIVLTHLNNNRFLGKRPLKFRGSLNNNFLENQEKELQAIENVTERVYKILVMSRDYVTIDVNNRFQCGMGANRSTVDVWRIYKYYFGDVNIFIIMRALYELVEQRRLATFRCPTIRKRVFWLDSGLSFRDYNTIAELGVPLRDWKDIGL